MLRVVVRKKTSPVREQRNDYDMGAFPKVKVEHAIHRISISLDNVAKGYPTIIAIATRE